MDSKLQQLINALNAAEKLLRSVEVQYPNSGEVEFVHNNLADMIAGLCELREAEETTNFN